MVDVDVGMFSQILLDRRLRKDLLSWVVDCSKYDWSIDCMSVWSLSVKAVGKGSSPASKDWKVCANVN